MRKSMVRKTPSTSAADGAAQAASPPEPAVEFQVSVHAAAHTDFSEFQESYLRDCLSRADTKATLLFGLTSALLAYLLGQNAFREMVLNPGWTWQSMSAILTTSLLGLSATLSILVIAPRLSSSQDRLVFFGSVARYGSSADYLAMIRSKDEEELTRDRIIHCYDVARICDKKYRTLQRVIWLSFGGIVTCLPLIGLI